MGRDGEIKRPKYIQIDRLKNSSLIKSRVVCVLGKPSWCSYWKHIFDVIIIMKLGRVTKLANHFSWWPHKYYFFLVLYLKTSKTLEGFDPQYESRTQLLATKSTHSSGAKQLYCYFLAPLITKQSYSSGAIAKFFCFSTIVHI